MYSDTAKVIALNQGTPSIVTDPSSGAISSVANMDVTMLLASNNRPFVITVPESSSADYGFGQTFTITVQSTTSTSSSSAATTTASS